MERRETKVIAKTYKVQQLKGKLTANILVNLNSEIGRQRMQKFINTLQRELTMAEVNGGTNAER
jgi:hypothetical protein